MAASGWDRGAVYYHNTLGRGEEEDGTISTTNATTAGHTDRQLVSKCQEFLEHFRIEESFVYREQLRRNVAMEEYLVVVHLAHLQAFDEQLATEIARHPDHVLPRFEQAARQLARQICVLSTEANNANTVGGLRDPLADLQVQLHSSGPPLTIRDLDAQHIGRLVRIPGIVVSASAVLARPTTVTVVCKGCREERVMRIPQGVGSFPLPRTCPGASAHLTDVSQVACPLDPYAILPEKCRCVDQQTLKLQEPPEMVPVGELPRQILLTVNRRLVNTVSPGMRLLATGVYSLSHNSGGASSNASSSVAIRTPFLHIVGLEPESSRSASMGSSSMLTSLPQAAMQHNSSRIFLSDDDEHARAMAAFSRQPDLYARFAHSIAPSIFGCDDVKKAIACLLFGGSRKRLPDRIRLRGDINVLLLGDPGVAKSQLLKFVEKVAPISVYTSGKGSSAAGLTASVVRDPSSGEFYLEGGAMVLADGGVVCIDEFDKMNGEDRVAIHEAMEQQTISIAKAGITTILNSRTSVLAAANPVFGRYDELKTPGENIDFSTTILSRFDMIFLLRDEHTPQRDMTLARHVLAVHMHANAMDPGSGDFDLNAMRKYIAYCKAHCAPRLSSDAADKLSNHYVSIRAQVHRMEQQHHHHQQSSASSERSTIPITIRQLEAIVRIAEALAKMTLSPIATEQHVDEALRLFRVSTMQAVLAGHSLEGIARPDLLHDVERIERTILQRLPVGSSVSYRALLRELVDSRRFLEHAVVRAIDVLVQRERLIFRSQRKLLIRQR